MKKLAYTANAPAQLANSFHNIYYRDDANEIRFKVEQLDKIGFKTSLDHYLAVICHGYQVMSERLKIHLVALIDFNAMGIKKAGKKALGTLVKSLPKDCRQNKFIKYIKTDIRNSITHYTYYFENHQLHLCKGVFDSSPKILSLGEFMMESRNLNILTESLLLIYLDKYHPGGDLLLDKF